MAVYDINGNDISGGGGGSIADGSVTPNKTSFFHESATYQLVNYGTLESGLIKNDGSNAANASYRRTQGYVGATAGTLYAVTYGGYFTRLVCYKSDKTFLAEASTDSYSASWTDWQGTTCNHRVYTIPANTAYVRFTYPTSVSDTIYLSKNDLPMGFNPTATDFSVVGDYPSKIWNGLGIPYLGNISKFKGKTIICAGDSIVEANTTNNNNPWCKMVADALGMTLYNDGQGGTGWAKNYYQRGCTVYRIENNWSSLYPANPDVILVMGNMNDGTGGGAGYSQLNPDWAGTLYMPVGTKDDASTTLSCHSITRRLVEDLITRYPKAKIGIVSSTPRSYTNSYFTDSQSYGHGWFEGYIEAHKYWCEEYNIPYLDLYHENPCLRPWVNGNATEYFYDATEVDGYTTGVHPNELGHLCGIAYPVIQWMLGWM